MNKDGSISIHQTIHGYENGHSLLGYSVELPSEVRRKMLPISDMSGNSMIDGFEEYLTAYPIKEINSFAIAKTWYAAEMERPGCVWTHTLIVSFVDVPLVADIKSLLELFKRPISSRNYSEYHEEIQMKPANRKETPSDFSMNNFDTSFVKTVIEQLYDNNEKTILIRGISSRHFDKLLLALWLQQWPRLKRNFSFCSGAIEPRALDKQYLDVQIIPNRAFRESQSFAIIDALKPNTSKASFEDWSELVYNDLKSPSILRSFLSTFGADVSGDRRSFKMLAECFLFFRDSKPSLQEAVTFITNCFPSPGEAYTLKANLLEAGKSDKNYFVPKYKEKEIFLFLSTTSLFIYFDYTKLKFESRFFDYFFKSPIDAIQVLEKVLEIEPNVFGEQLYRLLSNQLEKTGFGNLLVESPNLLTVLISLNPALTYSKNFWQTHSHLQMDIIRTLQRSADGRVDWLRVITLLLDNQAVIDPRSFEGHETHISSIILDWIDQNHDVPIDQVWTNYLEHNTEDVLSWLLKNDSPSPYSSALVINFLDPNSRIVVSKGAEPWLPTIDVVNQSEDHWLKPALASFCLPLAFNLTGSGAMKLIIFAFETVYNLLEKSQLPFRYWNFLEVHTKPLSIFKDWDKCKKIVNTLVDHTTQNGFDLPYIVDRIEDHKIRDRIRRRFNKVR